jgi:hypothetical protein
MELLYGFEVSGQNLSMNLNRLLVWGEKLQVSLRRHGYKELLSSMHLFQAILVAANDKS